LYNNVDINLDIYNQINRKLQQLQNTSIVVGVLGNSDSEILKRAVFTEFGTNKMPAWRWLYKSLNKMRPDYPRIVGQILSNVLANREINLNPIGIWSVGKVKEMIGIITTPRLSYSTIAMKGSSKPLINTGQMRNSISFEIRNNE
jgi:phage gpG-like protein